jgi:hypothetical protein
MGYLLLFFVKGIPFTDFLIRPQAVQNNGNAFPQPLTAPTVMPPMKYRCTKG